MYLHFKKIVRHKAIASIVILSFIFQSVLPLDMARSEASQPYSDTTQRGAGLESDSIKLPLSAGEIVDVYNGSGNKTIIDIQDAHCNYSAQHSIADIVECLNKNYSVKFIGLEGGKGPYDLSLFTNIKDAEIRAKVADHFVKEGLINGAELYAITNPSAVTLSGIEDADAYMENLNAYRDFLPVKDDAERCLNSLSRVMSDLKKKIYSQDLMAIDECANAFKDGRIDFKEYVKKLTDFSKKSGVDITPYKGLETLLRVMEEENRIDFKEAGLERTILVEKLTNTLPKKEVENLALKSLSFQKGAITPDEYYDYIFERARLCGVDIKKLPNLVKYSDYIKHYQSINKSSLMKELDALKEKCVSSLFQNEDQKTLYALDKDLSIIQRILETTLLRDEWDYYVANKDLFSTKRFMNFFARECPRYGVELPADKDLSRFDSYRERIEKFYTCSLKRDEAFIKNIDREFKDTGTGTLVLVTGGFHTDNLSRLFKDKGYSYIVIRPKIESTDMECPYFNLLAGKATKMDDLLSKCAIPSGNISNIAIMSLFSELKDSGRLKNVGEEITLLNAKFREEKGDPDIFTIKVGNDTFEVRLSPEKIENLESVFGSGVAVTEKEVRDIFDNPVYVYITTRGPIIKAKELEGVIHGLYVRTTTGERRIYINDAEIEKNLEKFNELLQMDLTKMDRAKAIGIVRRFIEGHEAFHALVDDLRNNGYALETMSRDEEESLADLFGKAYVQGTLDIDCGTLQFEFNNVLDALKKLKGNDANIQSLLSNALQANTIEGLLSQLGLKAVVISNATTAEIEKARAEGAVSRAQVAVVPVVGEEAAIQEKIAIARSRLAGREEKAPQEIKEAREAIDASLGKEIVQILGRTRDEYQPTRSEIEIVGIKGFFLKLWERMRENERLKFSIKLVSYLAMFGYVVAGYYQLSPVVSVLGFFTATSSVLIAFLEYETGRSFIERWNRKFSLEGKTALAIATTLSTFKMLIPAGFLMIALPTLIITGLAVTALTGSLQAIINAKEHKAGRISSYIVTMMLVVTSVVSSYTYIEDLADYSAWIIRTYSDWLRKIVNPNFTGGLSDIISDIGGKISGTMMTGIMAIREIGEENSLETTHRLTARHRELRKSFGDLSNAKQFYGVEAVLIETDLGEDGIGYHVKERNEKGQFVNVIVINTNPEFMKRFDNARQEAIFHAAREIFWESLGCSNHEAGILANIECPNTFGRAEGHEIGKIHLAMLNNKSTEALRRIAYEEPSNSRETLKKAFRIIAAHNLAADSHHLGTESDIDSHLKYEADIKREAYLMLRQRTGGKQEVRQAELAQALIKRAKAEAEKEKFKAAKDINAKLDEDRENVAAEIGRLEKQAAELRAEQQAEAAKTAAQATAVVVSPAPLAQVLPVVTTGAAGVQPIIGPSEVAGISAVNCPAGEGLASYAAVKQQTIIDTLKEILGGIFRNMFTERDVHIFVIGSVPTDDKGARIPESDLMTLRSPLTGTTTALNSKLNTDLVHTMTVESAQKMLIKMRDMINKPQGAKPSRIYCAIGQDILETFEKDPDLQEWAKSKLGIESGKLREFLLQHTILDIISDSKDVQVKDAKGNTIKQHIVYMMPYAKITYLGAARLNLAFLTENHVSTTDSSFIDSVNNLAKIICLISNNSTDLSALQKALLAASSKDPEFFKKCSLRIVLPLVMKLNLKELADDLKHQAEIGRAV